MALYHTVFLALAGHCWQAAASALNAAPAVVHPRQTTPQLLLPVPLQNTGSGHPDAEPALRTSESWYWGLDSELPFSVCLPLWTYDNLGINTE